MQPAVRAVWLLAALMLLSPQLVAEERPTMSAVLESAQPSDWRTPDQANLLYLKLPSGKVIMEVAPQFAPLVIANIRVLAGSDYFAKTSVLRSQENYVAQWGDPNAENAEDVDYEGRVDIGDAKETVKAEFFRNPEGLDITRIDSADAYADVVGFVSGFAVGADSDGRRAWLAHCYGAVGISRDNAPDSGNGTSLYVITGHAPRHLDRNVVVIGRVLRGMELLTTLPRGTGALGFYETPGEMTAIEWMRFGDQLPPDQRVALQVFRSDTEAFANLVEARRYRTEDWFVDPAGRIGLCNVPIPVRDAPKQ